MKDLFLSKQKYFDLSDISHKNVPLDQNLYYCIKNRISDISKHPNRIIQTNVPDTDVIDNQIQTAKYSLLNFIPLYLFE